MLDGLMKLKFFFSFLLVINTTYLIGQTLSEKYFPLELGKSWHFPNSIATADFTIPDTMSFAGNLYYAWQRNNLNEKYWSWLRHDSNRVFLLNLEDSTEHILYDFDAEVGDEWEIGIPAAAVGCSWGNKVRLAGKSDTLIWYGNQFTYVYHFQHYNSCNDAGLGSVYFVQNIGLVKFWEDNIAGPIDYELSSDGICTTVTGKIGMAGNPCTTIPCLPGVVFTLDQPGKYYVLSINGF